MDSFFSVRNMKLIAASLFLLGCATHKVDGRCKPFEVEFCNSTRQFNCTCRTCIKCPAGYGPSKQCGGSYLKGTVITCIPCRRGVDFSEEYSIASCENCPQCDGRKTLQECTPNSTSVCSETECRKGYRMDPALEDCVPTTVFTSARPITKKSTTLTKKIVIMANLSSSTLEFQSTSTNNENISPTKLITENTLLRPNQADIVNKGPEKAKKDTTDHRPWLNIVIILVALLSVFSVAILIVLGYIANTRKISTRQNYDGKKDEAEILLTSIISSSPRSSKESIEEVIPPKLRLKDIPEALSSELSTAISERSTTNKGWKDIGEKRGLNKNVLQAIQVAGEKRGTTEGEELFSKLSTSQPEFLLIEFVIILNQLERKDVVEIIKNHYRNANTEQTVEIYEHDQAQSE